MNSLITFLTVQMIYIKKIFIDFKESVLRYIN